MGLRLLPPPALRPEQRFREALGEVAWNASWLEGQLIEAASGLLGIDSDLGARMLPHNAGGLIDFAEQLLPRRVTNDELLDAALAWLCDARKLYKERNILLHSFWAPSFEDGGEWQGSSRKSTKSSERTIEQVRQTARQLEELANARFRETWSRVAEHMDTAWGTDATRGDS